MRGVPVSDIWKRWNGNQFTLVETGKRKFEAARKALSPNLSRQKPAAAMRFKAKAARGYMAEKSTRDHLLDVGLGLMHRNGYNATALADILQAADVPKGSFYHHFDSKENFAAVALREFAAREAKHAAKVLGDVKTAPLKRLKRYFAELVKIAGQTAAIPGCMLGRFSLEIAQDNPPLRKQISGSFEHWQQTIAIVIQQAVELKELPTSAHSESLAGFLLNSWEGALLRSQADKSDAALETFMRYAFNVLLTKNSEARLAKNR